MEIYSRPRLQNSFRQHWPRFNANWSNNYRLKRNYLQYLADLRHIEIIENTFMEINLARNT